MTSELALAAAILPLLAVSLAAFAVLKGWQGWLELRRQQLSTGAGAPRAGCELADLKRRVRRLEAIASGAAEPTSGDGPRRLC